MSFFRKILSHTSEKYAQQVQEILRKGDQAYAAGNLAKAEQTYREAFNTARRVRVHSEAVEALFTLAAVHATISTEQAMRDLQECEAFARSRLGKEDLSWVLGDLGSALANLGEREGAREKYLEGISLDKEHNYIRGWVDKLARLSRLNREAGRYSDCYANCVEGIHLSQSQREGAAFVTITLEYVELLRDCFYATDCARDWLQRLASMVLRYGNDLHLLEFEYQKGYLHLACQELQDAEESAGRICLLARCLRETDMLHTGQLLLAETSAARGDHAGFAEVLDYLKERGCDRIHPKVGILRTRLALYQHRLRDAVEIMGEVPPLHGWPELERLVLLAVVESRTGVRDQAVAYLQSSRQTLDEITRHTPPEFYASIRTKPEAVEFQEVEAVIA